MDCNFNSKKVPYRHQFVNRIALGTVQFGLSYGISNLVGQVSRSQARAMLQLALAAGIDTLDTAINYGDSEACLGSLGTDGFKVVTKLPAVPEHCIDVRAWVKQQVTSSFSRLGVTAVHGLLLHRPEQLLGPYGAELYRSMQGLKENGQVHKIGISIYSPSELVALLSQYRVDLVQAPFNLVDRRLCNSGWMRRLKADGVEVHTRSAFLQGLLLMSPTAMPSKFAPWHELWQTWFRWIADHDVSAVQACLGFPLSFPEIDRVVVGADNVSQLSQIVNAGKCRPICDFVDLACENENLINPSHWAGM